MPAVLPFLPLIISGIGGVLGAVGKSKPQTATQQSTSESQSTRTTEANLTKQQRQLMKQLAGILRGTLEQGPTVSQSDRNAGRTGINNTFLGIQKNLESALTSRGFGESGKLGAGFKGLEVGRANAFQGLESQLRNEAQSRFERMLGLTSGFIQPHNFTETGSGTTSSTGAATQPGQSLLAGLGGVAGDIGSALLLKSLLGGSGGGGGAGNSLGGGLANIGGGSGGGPFYP